MSGDGLKHEGLERLFSNQAFVTKHEVGYRDEARLAVAKNVAWVHDALQTLVDNPRLLENTEFLTGTLRSLIKSLDADSNPKMALLKIKEGHERRH